MFEFLSGAIEKASAVFGSLQVAGDTVLCKLGLRTPPKSVTFEFVEVDNGGQAAVEGQFTIDVKFTGDQTVSKSGVGSVDFMDVEGDTCDVEKLAHETEVYEFQAVETN